MAVQIIQALSAVATEIGTAATEFRVGWGNVFGGGRELTQMSIIQAKSWPHKCFAWPIAHLCGSLDTAFYSHPRRVSSFLKTFLKIACHAFHSLTDSTLPKEPRKIKTFNAFFITAPVRMPLPRNLRYSCPFEKFPGDWEVARPLQMAPWNWLEVCDAQMTFLKVFF